jgi:hypothetical protein
MTKKKGGSNGESRIIYTHDYLNGREIAEAVSKDITVNQAVYR